MANAEKNDYCQILGEIDNLPFDYQLNDKNCRKCQIIAIFDKNKI